MRTIKIQHVCPSCEENCFESGHGALSREDNETEVCNSCGAEEAADALEMHQAFKQRKRDLAYEIKKVFDEEEEEATINPLAYLNQHNGHSSLLDNLSVKQVVGMNIDELRVLSIADRNMWSRQYVRMALNSLKS